MFFNKLPESVDINGESIPINTDFRAWLKFELKITDYAETDEEKAKNIAEALLCVYPTIPSDIKKAVEKACEFYSCDRVQVKGKSLGNIYSAEHDAPYIYAAFKEQYGIDLQEIEHLHWYKYRSMFIGLTECKLTEIISYRAVDLSQKMSSEMKRFYREMKETYALPRPQSVIDKETAIREALLNGGDLTGIL